MTVNAADAYSTTSEWVNGGPGSDQDFIDRFLRDHNTLQSQVVSLWLKTLYAWVDFVETDGPDGGRNGSWRIDARNETAYRKAKAIVDLLGPKGYQVPFI